MIAIRVLRNGLVEISAPECPEAEGWLSGLCTDEFFASDKSEATVAFPASDHEEFNEDWEEYALPGVLSAASEWRKKFARGEGRLVFRPEESLELAGYLNRARLKIAMEGTGDVLPPSEASPRSRQYFFLTALQELVLSLPRSIGLADSPAPGREAGE